MATLFSRLFSLGYTLDQEQRKELGNIVKTQFFSTELKQKFYKKVDQQEAGTTFQVLYYDPRFTPRIDQLITFYAELHGIKNTPRKPKKKFPKRYLSRKNQSKKQPKLLHKSLHHNQLSQKENVFQYPLESGQSFFHRSLLIQQNPKTINNDLRRETKRPKMAKETSGNS